MQRLRQFVKDNSYLPFAAYLVGVSGYGMWALMEHVHWVVPFILIGLSTVTGKRPLVILNVVVALVMAVYGFSVQMAIPWYKALALGASPLLLLMVLTWVAYRVLGLKINEPESPAA
ncbi:hypothetical protein [Burkholderia ubonensis]|uniref:hypothetical protein n=1 Tax=Burkholderia ubonensis TaxID=101571 RepID=UPI00075AF786|nr:hypothetical protein [Burkholderia ubonensis]KVP16773.1 hypothetical protein WJ84_00435 [Burkholderia ubonensis]